VVVTHGKGIDFLLNDAKDEKGEAYQTQVAGLKEKGVDFRVCQNTLKGRKLEDSAVLMDATVVPSGVAEIGTVAGKRRLRLSEALKDSDPLRARARVESYALRDAIRMCEGACGLICPEWRLPQSSMPTPMTGSAFFYALRMKCSR